MGGYSWPVAGFVGFFTDEGDAGMRPGRTHERRSGRVGAAPQLATQFDASARVVIAELAIVRGLLPAR